MMDMDRFLFDESILFDIMTERWDLDAWRDTRPIIGKKE